MNRIAMDIKKWREEAVRLFGKDWMKWRFVCPACGHIATPGDFLALGKDPNDASRNCIGRANGKGRTPDINEPAPDGCNWCAYGLFGTMDKGRRIFTEEGNNIEIFDFARE